MINAFTVKLRNTGLERNELINNRLRLNKDYFRSNDLLCSAYNFVKQVTDFVIMNKSS